MRSLLALALSLTLVSIAFGQDLPPIIDAAPPDDVEVAIAKAKARAAIAIECAKTSDTQLCLAICRAADAIERAKIELAKPERIERVPKQLPECPVDFTDLSPPVQGPCGAGCQCGCVNTGACDCAARRASAPKAATKTKASLPPLPAGAKAGDVFTLNEATNRWTLDRQQQTRPGATRPTPTLSLPSWPPFLNDCPNGRCPNTR